MIEVIFFLSYYPTYPAGKDQYPAGSRIIAISGPDIQRDTLSGAPLVLQGDVTLGEMIQVNLCPNCTISDRQDVGTVYILAADISDTCYCYFTV